MMNNAAIAFHDFEPERDNFLQDALTGLAKLQKDIPAKYFYDTRGSELFDQICELEEYYPTRTEIALLNKHSREIAELFGENCLLIEYGSGSSRKVSVLLDAMSAPRAYMPVDICKEFLLESSARIAALQTGLEVIAICADYTKLANIPQVSKYCGSKKIIFFPGSTIGNSTPLEAIRLLKNAWGLLGKGGGMLIGVDLKKEESILHAAYNDARGLTAEFNLNLLSRMNRELGADFRTGNFSHQAWYNAQSGRIEMHLLSEQAQTVTIANTAFHFREGESLHTENSHKYTLAEFQAIAATAGFRPVQAWVDENNLFSLHYLAAD